jgi:hypothetical protein
VARARARPKVGVAIGKVAAIQSLVNALGCNKVLAPAFYFYRRSLICIDEKQQHSNNEFFFIGIHPSCLAYRLAIFGICTIVLSRKRLSVARG